MPPWDDASLLTAIGRNPVRQMHRLCRDTPSETHSGHRSTNRSCPSGVSVWIRPTRRTDSQAAPSRWSAKHSPRDRENDRRDHHAKPHLRNVRASSPRLLTLQHRVEARVEAQNCRDLGPYRSRCAGGSIREGDRVPRGEFVGRLASAPRQSRHRLARSPATEGEAGTDADLRWAATPQDASNRSSRDREYVRRSSAVRRRGQEPR